MESGWGGGLTGWMEGAKTRMESRFWEGGLRFGGVDSFGSHCLSAAVQGLTRKKLEDFQAL